MFKIINSYYKTAQWKLLRQSNREIFKFYFTQKLHEWRLSIKSSNSPINGSFWRGSTFQVHPSKTAEHSSGLRARGRIRSGPRPWRALHQGSLLHWSISLELIQSRIKVNKHFPNKNLRLSQWNSIKLGHIFSVKCRKLHKICNDQSARFYLPKIFEFL